MSKRATTTIIWIYNLINNKKNVTSAEVYVLYIFKKLNAFLFLNKKLYLILLLNFKI